jgi:hypothetical protein
MPRPNDVPPSRESGRGQPPALAVGLVCLVVGAGAGLGLSRRTLPTKAALTPTPPSEAASVVVVGSTSARLAEEDRAALRAMIHEELVAERSLAEARADAGHAAPSDAQPEEALSSVQLKAYDRARAQVDHGLAGGVWTDDDKMQLHASLARLPVESWMDVVGPLIVAVNARKVRPERPGPLF